MMKMVCSNISLVALAGGGLLVVMLLSAASPATAVVYEDTLDVDGDATRYGVFLDSFHLHLNGTAASYIEGHPVLKAQSPTNPPADWFHVTLKSGHHQVTLAIRGDNLYVLGFKNQHGWFSFKGEKNLIPQSTELSFDGGYNQLFSQQSGGWRKLATLPVNGAQGVAHLGKLANLRPADVAAGRDASLKGPLAFFILAVSEAERFAPIRSAVAAAWADKTPHFLPEQAVVRLVVNWSEFSCAVMCWKKLGETPAAWAKDIKKFNVRTAQDALSIVRPILQVAKCVCDKKKV